MYFFLHIQGIQGNGVKNFDDARAACQGFPGGELASIHFQGVQCKFFSLSCITRYTPEQWISISPLVVMHATVTLLIDYL